MGNVLHMPNSSAFSFRFHASFAVFWQTILLIVLSLVLAGCGQGEAVVPDSANANLVSIELSDGELEQDFDRSITAYRVSVASHVHAITVTSVAEDEEASVHINGLSRTQMELELGFGENTIEVLVTAPDSKTQRKYTLTVFRPPNEVARLQALSFVAHEGAFLQPAFNPLVTDYKMLVPFSQSQVSVRPEAENGSLISVDGRNVLSGGVSGAFPLALGSTYVDIKVLAQDGVNSRTYRVEMIRESSGVLKTDDMLRSLQLFVNGQSVALDSAFSPNENSYSISFENQIDSLSIKALAKNTPTRQLVDGDPVSSGGATVKVNGAVVTPHWKMPEEVDGVVLPGYWVAPEPIAYRTSPDQSWVVQR
jgi:hypothetical protein